MTRAWLADAADHLELDEPVQLHRVFERELLRDRFDEPVDDHHVGLLFGQAARHEVEDLVRRDLADGRFVRDLDLVLHDLHVGDRVVLRLVVKEERVALDLDLRVGRVGPKILYRK